MIFNSINWLQCVAHNYALFVLTYRYREFSIYYVIPFWEDEIAPKLIDGKNVIIAAHGNSLRALSKYIENISDEDIINLEMATGEPVVYDFNEKLEVQSKTKLN
ncbi:hypothetical protein PP40703_04720 [Pediococcus pentosaceus]|nr:hypothetical protein PP40703_04720 [Pediococcus pentosaceus]